MSRESPCGLGLNPNVRITFLHNAPPFFGPVIQLLGIGLLDLGTLLEAADQLVAEFVAVVDPLHCPLVVPRLSSRNSEAGRCQIRFIQY